MSNGLSADRRSEGGGRRMGEGAREGLAEWMLRVRRGPRKGLVEGV